MMKKLKIIAILAVLTAISQLANAEQNKITPTGNFQALGAYSDTNKGKGFWGYDFSGSYAPMVKLNDSQYLIPLYSGVIEHMRQYVTQEEGGRLYNDFQLHNLSVALRNKHSEEWSSRITGLATWNFLKETQDESFGTGLYDYRDFGAAFDLRQRLKLGGDTEHEYSWGIKYFRRTYPNYQSLISLSTVTAPETDEKDFDAIGLSFGFEELLKRGISWEMRPSLMLKYFTDKKQIGDDGVLKDDNRRDYVLGLDFNGDWPLKEGRWVVSADNNLTYNHSNMDYYDSGNTLILSDDVFSRNYYSFFSASTYPYVTYYHPMGKDKRLALRAGYSFLYRHYPGRKVQEADGTYTDSKQRDHEHAVHLSSSYPISKELSWVSYFDYTWARSNQKFEQFYYYAYNIYQIQTGIAVAF